MKIRTVDALSVLAVIASRHPQHWRRMPPPARPRSPNAWSATPSATAPRTRSAPNSTGSTAANPAPSKDYSYSDANKNSGIWNEAEFKEYIKDPKAKVPGTKMIFAGIKNETEINNLWAFVSQFDKDGKVKQ